MSRTVWASDGPPQKSVPTATNPRKTRENRRIAPPPGSPIKRAGPGKVPSRKVVNHVLCTPGDRIADSTRSVQKPSRAHVMLVELLGANRRCRSGNEIPPLTQVEATRCSAIVALSQPFEVTTRLQRAGLSPTTRPNARVNAV